MEAANYGALEHLHECNLNGDIVCKPVVSAGIGLLRLNKEKSNPYVQTNILMEHFFIRKWLLVRYSVGFLVFPGGVGTLDELFEIVTLRQTERMQKAPILLMDSSYWQPIIDWLKEKPLKEKLMDENDLNIFRVIDSVEEACKIINKYCKK